MWKPIRKFLNDIHLYAGLISGLIVIAVCLSGTIYVYNTEIREFADSERYFVQKGGNRLSLDKLKSEVEQQLGAEVVGVNVYESDDRSVQFSVKLEGEERPVTYFVNPYSAAILADSKERTASEEFMGYMFSLHRWLLLDRVEEPILESMGNRDLGRFINGIATLLFLLGVITGIVIWFPQKVKNWKQGLKIKWSGNWKRVNHDLHNTMAFYSLLTLFLMAVTGPFWSYQWYREGWQKTWDIYQAPSNPAPQSKSEEISTAEIVEEETVLPLISLDEVLQVSNQNLDYAGFVRISLPSDGKGEVSISKSRTGFFAKSGSDQLTLDPNSLAVKETKLFSDLPVRQQIGRSVKALHTGEIFGQFTKFLWFLGCLIATSLPITGTLIWWNKRGKKKSSQRKKAQSSAMEVA
ncbi:putative iron-regulated membrane protein [Algoriphagus boseongensis]|uniref:Putative iron-regulated membrane protein n=1 Tax=Algoriphagus boseongensis TaxID=1442587 RepID=A0A4R6T801_9BACT|nr:PepSY-associated TM helix domain-containing protein [Algoriphagus boseongensis]TDQ18263.1 putative iron-regulated membrane protein [Algoriphagus boseongensis]